MKNLKYLAIGVICFVAVGISGVCAAAYVDEETMPEGNAWMGWYENTTVEEKEGVYYVTMGTDISTDLIIQEGEEVVLDLNGHTLTNFTDDCEAIKVLAGGKLTIVNSSSEGGLVTQKESSKYSVITNQGTLIIESGNFETSLSKYIVRNEADMTINGGTFTSTSTDTSMIGNIRTTDEDGVEIADNPVIPELTINDGTFNAVSNAVINNANSVVVINDGEFTSENAFALDNMATATINGGTFTSTNNNAIRISVRGTEVPENLSLTITNGKFVSADDAESDIIYRLGDVTVPATIEVATVTGGTFSSDVSSFLGDSYEVDENGTITEKEEVTTPPEEETPTNPETPSEEIPELPQTYDGVVVSIVVGVIALAVVATGIILAKKKKLFN